MLTIIVSFYTTFESITETYSRKQSQGSYNLVQI